MLNTTESAVQDRSEAAEAAEAAVPRPVRFALGTLERNVGVHISLAGAAIHKHLLNQLEQFGLTQKQVAILWLIVENPEIAKSDLARLLWVERATIQIMVKSLVDRGMVAQEPSPRDGRRIVLSLTEEGKAVFPRAKAAVEQHEEWLKQRFSAAEVAQVTDLMKRIYA
jgi:DNA-binding MarR family transcriptional regulator